MALQSRINAGLAAEVGGGLVAAAISFATGLVLALLLVAVWPRSRAGLARLPAALRGGSLRPWQLLGGMGGAWLVTTQGLTVGLVGVTAFIVAVVAGQVAGSLGVDRLGLSPVGVLTVNRQRALAALLAVVAVTVAGWGTFQLGGAAALVAVLFAATAGAAISVQQAINARVSAAANDALAAATVNFVVGFTALLTAVLVGLLIGVIDLGQLPGDPRLYLGGPIGVLFIALAAWAVRGLGVLVFGLLSIAGQLAGAVLLDLFLPATESPLGYGSVVGLLLVAVAVWLAGRGTPQRPDDRMTA